MDLNLVSIVYLFYRLAPFIIVCFFTLNSIINQDLRGLMYLCGLLILVFVIFLSNSSYALIFALVANIILMASLGMIKFLDIFKPFKIITDALSVVYKNIILAISSTVIVILVLGTYVLHAYEFYKIEKLDKTMGQKDNTPGLNSFYGSIVDFFRYIDSEQSQDESDGYCMEFSINGNEVKKPLAACIYGFTYGYLMFFINKYNLTNNNIPIVTLFPILIIGDLAFQRFHKCRPSLFTNILALVLGISWGVNWGDIIAKMKNASLQYFVGANQPVSSVPSSQQFKCDLYQDGKMIDTKKLANLQSS